MKYIIRPSSIHNTGVFATENIQKGAVVFRWNTERCFGKEEFDSLDADAKNFVTYQEGKYILMQAPERYMNHSCEPNTHVSDFCDIALRDIMAGEELTTDYSLTMIPGDRMICSCHAKNCLKTIL